MSISFFSSTINILIPTLQKKTIFKLPIIFATRFFS
nr:MAG TPA: hypothetical protein [Caudoviricetes sp.]